MEVGVADPTTTTSQRGITRSFTDVKLTPVILVCIHNVGGTVITHELLHTVFSTYGKILRILIFEKSKKWKAFVEYDNVEHAIEARRNLDEFLLFNDGTRMNIYPSNLTTIKFQNNNSGGVDYTLMEEQPLFSSKKEPLSAGLKPTFKKPSQEGSPNKKLPQQQNFDHPDETWNRSTSAGSRTHTNSGHNSVDDDKEEEILKMIDNHHKDGKTHGEEEELHQSEEDNEKDNFNKFVQDAFFSFKTSEKLPTVDSLPSPTGSWNQIPNTSNLYKPSPFQPFSQNDDLQPKLTRFPNSLTHIPTNINPPNSFGTSPSITRNNTFGELPSFSSMNSIGQIPHFSSASNLPEIQSHNLQPPPGMSRLNQIPHKPMLNPRFGSHPDLPLGGEFPTDQRNMIDMIERDIIARIMSKVQSQPDLESQIAQQFGTLDYNNLSQMNKETLGQLYNSLSVILGKESENKKSPVLHVNGLEHKEIRVQMLYNIFSNFGNILKIIFMKSKASALIEFENVDYATIAKDYLNNIVFMGKPLRVNYSNYPTIQIRNKQSSKFSSEETFIGNPKNFRFKKNKNISINPPSSTMHISNLVKEVCTDENVIKNYFSQYGKVEAIKFLFGDNSKNMCLLRMGSIEESLRAMAYLHDTDLKGRKIQISFTRSKI